MKQPLRNLTAAVIAVMTATTVLVEFEARGQGTGDRGQGNSEFGIQNSALPSGSTIVADAARRIASEQAISAEMRYRIDAFGHELVGTGNYLQFGPGPEKLLRLDLKMQVGDKLATIQEIRGAEAYWVRRDVPPTPSSLGYVDLRQLRKNAALTSTAAPPSVMPQDDWIMLGGLARLIAALDQNFAFDAPKADEIHFTAGDGKSIIRLPIWRTSGTWKPDRLATLTERDPKKPASLPEQLPDRVDLVLGRTDDVLTLFPYRISYFRTPSPDKNAPKDAAPPAPRELLTLELFNVSRKPIDPREFQYQPGDQDVKNLTQYYVQRMSGDTKLR